MKENIALVGFSINAEVYVSFDANTTLEKAPFESIDAGLGGTSANVALAIQTFGGRSKLLAPMGEVDDFKTHTLEFVLRNCKIPYQRFPILTSSHIAFLPYNSGQLKTVFGWKGEILEQKLQQTYADIDKETGLWRIATGVRLEEIQLVKHLFNKHIGFRSLNPRMELIQNTKIFHQVLENTDLLILNYAEYRLCQVTSPDKLHEFGPSLVIVTDAENGGMFSSRETGAEGFVACKDYISEGEKIFTTGAGDWFHGSFLSKCMENEKPFHALTREEIITFISFAARVAGKKITMKGASNGPQLSAL